MEEKPVELSVSPQEFQIQAPSFLDKIKPQAGGHKFKILAGVLGVLVFAGVVLGAYKLGQKQVKPALKPTPTPVAVATPTPDPTANWKTYTNTKYGYSVKYPSDWYLYPDKFVIGPQNRYGVTAVTSFDLEVDQQRTSTETVVSPGEFMVTIGLETEDKPESQAIEEWLKGRGSAFEVLSEIKITLAGTQAIKQATERGTTVYIPQDSKVYFIHGTTNILSKHGDTFNFMLSTFKFLE